MNRRAEQARRRGARFMSFGLFGGLGAIGERLGMGHPLDDFDPEAFQHGAYGTSAPPEDREPPRPPERGEPGAGHSGA